MQSLCHHEDASLALFSFFLLGIVFLADELQSYLFHASEICKRDIRAPTMPPYHSINKRGSSLYDWRAESQKLVWEQ